MGTAIDKKVSSCLAKAGVDPVDKLQLIAKECTKLSRLEPKPKPRNANGSNRHQTGANAVIGSQKFLKHLKCFR